MKLAKCLPNSRQTAPRVLMEREVMRIGGVNVIKVDVRVIAATNKNLMHGVMGSGLQLHHAATGGFTVVDWQQIHEDPAVLQKKMLSLLSGSA